MGVGGGYSSSCVYQFVSTDASVATTQHNEERRGEEVRGFTTRSLRYEEIQEKEQKTFPASERPATPTRVHKDRGSASSPAIWGIGRPLHIRACPT